MHRSKHFSLPTFVLAMLVMLQVVGVSPAGATTGQRGSAARPTAVVPPARQVPKPPKPMTLAERQAQVEKLQSAHRSARRNEAYSATEWVRKRHDAPGGHRMTGMRKSSRSAAIASSAPASAAIGPPFNFVVPGDFELDPGTIYWGIDWEQPASAVAYHITVHRASDNVKIDEYCFNAGFPSSAGSYGWYMTPEHGYVPGVGYYGKVAVTASGTAQEWSLDWSCGTDWSAEAISPVVVARGGASVLPANETLGCGLSNASGRPCFQAFRGDPVNTATGGLSESVVDAHVPAPGVDFRLARTYSSASNVSVWLGPRWAHSYPLWVNVSSGRANLRLEDGSYAVFKDLGAGKWETASAGVQATLAGTLATGLTLTTVDQEKLTFDSVGYLASWKDRSGIGLSFSYTNSKLTGVTDGAGRTHTFAYDATSGRLNRVTLADGRYLAYTYDSGNRLATVRDLNGGITKYTYDASQRLNSITDPRNKLVMQTTYDSSGRVIQQTDATGHTTQPTWGSSVANFPDNNGGIWTDIYKGSVLTEQIDPLGKVTAYEYDFNKPNPTLRPIKITDRNNHVTTMTYDTRGNMLSRSSPTSVGIVESWTYDAANNVTSYTDGRGKKTIYGYDGQARLLTETDPLGGKTSYTYTTAGDVKTVTTPAGRVTTYGYDTAGNVTSMTTLGGRKTTYTYDAAGRMLSSTDPRGNVTGADPAKYTTRYTYDGAGRMLTSTDPAGRVFAYGYDANGNQTSVTDPDNHVTTYVYDNANRLTDVTNPAGHTRSTRYDDAGNITSTTEATGAKTTYHYDAAGRLHHVVGPRGNATGGDPATDTTNYGYDNEGYPTSVTDPSGAVTETKYDDVNRPTQVIDPLQRITKYGYDKAGNQTSVTDPSGAVTSWQYDDTGRLDATIDALTKTTSYDHDPDGLRTHEVNPLGHTTTWKYDNDGRLESMTDPRGNAAGATAADFTTSFQYDAAGNRTKIIDPLGRSTVTEYDASNRPTKVFDANNHPTAYEYDSLGRVQKVTPPNHPATSFGYDLAGNLETVTTPMGKIYDYDHDKSGRVTAVKTPGGRVTGYAYTWDGLVDTMTLPAGSIKYTYDRAGRTTKVDYSDTTPDLTYTYDGAGQIKTASNGTSTATYGYDTAGRVNSIVRGGKTFGYGWNKNGQLERRTLPDGRVQSYTWSDDHRMSGTKLTSDATSWQVSYGYDVAGNRTSVTRQGGPSSAYTYDRAGSLTRVAHTSGSTMLVSQDVTRNLAGAPDTVTTTRGGSTSRAIYSYDDIGQVTRVCRPAAGTTCAATDQQTSYGYDHNGNRKSKVTTQSGSTSTTTYAYDDDDRPTGRTVNGATTTLTYNANGALATEVGPGGTTTYGYGLDANLRRVQPPTGPVVGYDYDEDGNRIGRTVNASTDATWTVDTLGLPTRVEEKNGSGTLTHKWWEEPQGQLGSAIADTVAATPAWLLDDYQGSVTDLANATALTGSATIDPFGEVVTSSGTYANNPLRFHGQYLDQKNGLYDVRARDYDAGNGRFTTPDPVPQALGTSFTQTYHYGYNRPTVLSDPTGQCAIVCTAIIGGIVGGAVGGVDCWLSGDDRNTCIKKVVVGAAAGALTGATMGMAGGAGTGLYGGLAAGSQSGVRQVATSAIVGGSGSALYGSGVAAWTGQPYSYSDAGQDFLWGAAFGGVGGYPGSRAGGLLNGAQCPGVPSGGFPKRAYVGRTPTELIDVNVHDPAAIALAARIGGRPSVKFEPRGREFDAVSQRYVAQSKPANYKMGSDFRNQAKATFEKAIETGRVPYFHFEGPPAGGVLRKLHEYGVRYGIEPVIDTRPLGG